jgi:hypothetical protein
VWRFRCTAFSPASFEVITARTMKKEKDSPFRRQTAAQLHVQDSTSHETPETRNFT